jgi:hypothetical protein
LKGYHQFSCEQTLSKSLFDPAEMLNCLTSLNS